MTRSRLLALFVAGLALGCGRSASSSDAADSLPTDAVSVPTADPPKPVKTLTVKETSLGVIPEGTVPGSIVVSPDGARLAYIVDTGRGHRVVLDGKEQPVFTFVFPKTLKFSPDSKRFAYTVGLSTARKPPTAVVIDGTRGPVFDQIRPSEDGSNTYFSPDSKRVAYVAERKGQSIAVVDGVEGKAHPGFLATAGVIWSRDGRRWGTMMMTPQQKGYVIIDDVAGLLHDMLTVPAGMNSAGTEVTEYAADRGITFSADGSHYAYGAQNGANSVLIVDGKEVARQPAKRARSKDANGNPVDITEGGISNIAYGPTGDRLVYLVSQGTEKQWYVVDGQPQKEYVAIATGARFSRDGKHFAYFASPKAGRRLVVRDGVEGKEDDAPGDDAAFDGDVALSADGSRMAAKIRRSGKSLVTVDGTDGKEYEEALFPQFSPDGKRLGHLAVKGQEVMLVLDGMEGKPYQDFTPPGPQFGESGHVTWGVARDKRWRVAVDLLETQETYDGFAARTLVQFVGPTTVRAVAIRGNELLRLDVELGY